MCLHVLSEVNFEIRNILIFSLTLLVKAYYNLKDIETIPPSRAINLKCDVSHS